MALNKSPMWGVRSLNLCVNLCLTFLKFVQKLSLPHDD
jgi:hypothetical protein